MAEETPVIVYEWEGDVMRPLPNFAKLADRVLVIGERYRMTAREERSLASHNAYFAAVHSGWLNLPEKMIEQFPTDEHLRKFALIKTGFHNKVQYVAPTRDDARFVVDLIRPFDSYALVEATGAVVSVYTAMSQSMAPPPRGMGKKLFLESADKVLDYIADLVGTTADALRKSGKEDAG